MRTIPAHWAVLMAGILTLAAACGSSSSGAAGNGGGSARGGAGGNGGGSGGTIATGGAASGGAGGAVTTTGVGGATTSSGGASATGGSPGSVGVAGAGAGGTTATGGSAMGGAVGGATGAAGGSATGGRTTATGGVGGGADAAVADAATPADATDTSADASTKEVPAADAPVACGASQPPPKSGDSTATLQHGGRTRSYLLHAPSGLTAGSPVPVVIDLHGAGGNGKQQQGMSGFSGLADKEKLLAVFPDGVDGYWNVDDTCCGTAGKQKIDDVGFLKAIIAKLSQETCIDAKRIYVSGFSNGGGLAHRMGCDAAEVVAAVAPAATDLRTQPCKPSRPISMMEIRPMADSLEPYEGGLVGPAGGQYLAVGAKQSLALWAEINQCGTGTTTLETYCEVRTPCADGVETVLCSLPNTDHSPYANSLGFNVAAVAWKMFQRQPMK